MTAAVIYGNARTGRPCLKKKKTSASVVDSKVHSAGPFQELCNSSHHHSDKLGK